MPRTIRCADLFCGAGGSSTGLLQACDALGLKADLTAVNHDETAIETHSANHPRARHLQHDLDSVDPRKVIPGKKLDVLLASPECTHHSTARGGKPCDDQSRSSAMHVIRWAEALQPSVILVENVREFCFPADTVVLSKRGMVPIGEIQVGDEVWTHNARWKPVTAVMRRVSSTVAVKGWGNSIIETTPNHQFYAREYAPRITQSGKWGRHEARLLEPQWVRADQLAGRDGSTAYTAKYSGYAWATPSELPRYWMRLPKTLGVDVKAPAFFYMIGRWLGDGWIRKRNTRQHLVRICANTEEANALQLKLIETGLKWSRHRHSESVDVFDLCAASSRVLILWLRSNFGEYAEHKTLPAWVYGASEEQRRALLDGYHDSDGCERGDGVVSSTSVSRCLAVGVKLLLQSLGVAASISKVEARTAPRVDDPDRLMTCQAAYSVSWRRETEFEKCHRMELHLWGPIREVAHCRDEVEVVDITVADDHSFVADGQVVHNCSWGPLGVNGRPLKSKRGETFQAWLQMLRSLNYTVDYRLLNAADHGDPTTRIRLFVLARRGKHPPAWPEPTHARDPQADLFGSLEPWRSAREVIDWKLKGASIFSRKKSLSENTLARIKAGLRKFGGEAFLCHTTHQGGDRVSGLHVPVPTVTGANRGEQALIEPFLLGQQSGSVARAMEEPVPTVSTDGAISLVEPFVVQFKGTGQDQIPATARGVNTPLGTVTAGGGNFGLCEPFLVKFNGTGGAHPVNEPVDTVTARDRFGLVEVDGVQLDILFRMLQPHELAAAQGFPSDYIFRGNRAQQVKQIGNAVPVNTSRALCLALLQSLPRR